MKLTTSQIDQLFTFTHQQYVEYYDLQSELVDHLANAIEEQWHENPKRSFEEALNIEFKKFGVFGFVDVVTKRRAVLNKKYYKIVWQYFKDFFSIPKIILAIASTLSMCMVLKLNTYREYIFFGIYLSLFAGMFYELYKNHQINKKRKQSGEKKRLFEEVIHNYGYCTGVIIVPFNIMFQVYNHLIDFFIDDYATMGLSFFLVTFSLLLFIIFKTISLKAESYLLETYPEYKFEKL